MAGLRGLGWWLAGAALGAALLVGLTSRLSAELRRWVYVGTPLLELSTPLPDQELTRAGVEVLVRFNGSRVSPPSFRCLLNGRDVTDQLTVGENGAGGAVVGLAEGANQIRVEVFGRGWWRDRYFEDSRQVRVIVRPLPFIDRA